MKIEKEQIEITSFAVGFHSFRKDHNYGNYKASFINDLQSLLNMNFDSIKVGSIDVLKRGLDEAFEIRLTPSTVIYQNNQSFEEFSTNAKEVLRLWLQYSPNVKLSLIGLITMFEIKIDKPSATNLFVIKDKFFQDFRLGNKLKGVDFHFQYCTNYDGYDYNIHTSLAEKNEKEYHLEGNIDFNSTSENKLIGLSPEFCDRIFNSAQKYFRNEFFNFLNFGENNGK